MKAKPYLCLDLAPAEGSIALFGADVLEKPIPGSLRHTEQIIPVIDTLLKESGLALEALAGIVLNRGPGSFTGLRVAYSSGKALAHSRGLSLHSVSGTAARALGFLASHPEAKLDSLRVVTCLTQEKFLVEEQLVSRAEFKTMLESPREIFLIDPATQKTLEIKESANVIVYGSRAKDLGLAFSSGKSRKDYTTEKERIEAVPEYYGTARYETK